MFIFTITAKPYPNNKDVDKDVTGASIKAWINFPEREAAEMVANFYIHQNGWGPENTTEALWVEEKDIAEEDREFYREALEYGSTFIFNIWGGKPQAAGDETDEE
ncbi:hypothetical protein FKG94_15725 [Exilibacterium tricleocarpae]|uniref:Uncharacterized protein n=1 Tax=Exilibacterium tricleocarpae TaxID=2591008 RepID=A0A545TFP9_9GAMM|nr:hypothetical protein [Exilibacterium tricleocarpae]TQV76057.1 hypothetical protein FKG94_15725 [Exilibacterium tricleocarpae]